MLPKSALRSLREANPEIAIGLGYSKGEDTTELFTEGPLWRGSPLQVKHDARWHIGSITKSMTATIVLQQVDEGKLNLKQPIGDYFPSVDNMHERWRALTLTQLLSHTGGITPNPTRWQSHKWRGLDAVLGRHKVLANAWAKPPKFPNGEHLYSNIGYMLIGRILEEVLEMSWEAILQQKIGAPLELKSTGFGAPPGRTDPKGHRMSFYRLLPMERDDIASDNPSWFGPAGTVHMSIGDLLTYGRAHLKAARGELPNFLSRQSSSSMRIPVSNDYGLGWVIQDDTVWHNGSNSMWYALLIIDPISDTVVVATQNAMMRTDKIDALARETIRNFRICEPDSGHSR